MVWKGRLLELPNLWKQQFDLIPRFFITNTSLTSTLPTFGKDNETYLPIIYQ